MIGDIWTVYAGEMIVGIKNPRAYYFGENDPQRRNLFTRMQREPSPQVMIEAMNQTGTDTTVAYFIVTEARLDIDPARANEKFNSTISKALQNELQVFGPSNGFGNGKLYIFRYEE